MTQTQTRYSALDGLRGLAAFSVFLGHLLGFGILSDFTAKFEDSFLRVFWDGAACVDLFFVLSSFVLFLQLERLQGAQGIVLYYKKRLLRLFPAYLFALLVAFVLFISTKDYLAIGYSSWGSKMWSENISIIQLLKHATMVLPFNTELLNPPFWSLVVEMRMSIVLPFLFILFAFIKESRIPFLILISAIISYYVGPLEYLFDFVLGFALAYYYPKLKEVELSVPFLLILGMIAIIFYGNRWVGFGIIHWWSSVVTSLGAILLIILALRVKILTDLLNTPICSFLGKISYSFYLIHMPLLIFFSKIISNHLCFVAVSSVSAVALSFCMYKYVEIPFINIGKRLK